MATTPRRSGAAPTTTGQPTPLGVVTLLDGSVEGVEINVHDKAGHGPDGAALIF